MTGPDETRPAPVRSFGQQVGAAATLRPFKLYLPRTKLETIAALREARGLGQRPCVYRPGDRVDELPIEDGVVLSLERLDRVIALDEEEATVTVEPGVPFETLERRLAERGFALPMRGDDPHCSVASFAALGGSSWSSHRDGLFVDHVLEVELIGLDGRARTSRDRAQFALDLRSSGEVLSRLTLAVVPLETRALALSRHERRLRDVVSFVAVSGAALRDRDAAVMKRARLSLPATGELRAVGSLLWFEASDRASAKSVRGNVLTRAVSHARTLVSRRARRTLEDAQREREREAMAAERGHVFRFMGPMACYERLLASLYHRCASHRLRGSFGSCALDAVAITTPGRADAPHACELRVIVAHPRARRAASTLRLGTFGQELELVAAHCGAQRIKLAVPALDSTLS